MSPGDARVEVPLTVAAKARLSGADDWLDGLDELVAERVSTGLLCTLIDAQPVGREMLEVADLLAAAPAAERDVTSA